MLSANEISLLRAPRDSRNDTKESLPLMFTRFARQIGVLLVAVGLAFAGAVGTAGTAAADTQLFDVWNLSGGDITLISYTVDSDGKYRHEEGTPGQKIRPGKNWQIGLDLHWGGIALFRGIWAKNGQEQNWGIVIGNDGPWHISIECSTKVSPTTSVCGSYIGNNVATVADQRDTFINVPASDKARQDQLKGDLCGNPYAKQLGIRCDQAADHLTISAGNATWTLPNK
jgi:hypothetical protein